MRVFIGDQVFRSPRDLSLFFEEADVCVRGVSSSGANLLFEVRPQRASELAVCTGLESPRVLVGTPYRCCGTE